MGSKKVIKRSILLKVSEDAMTMLGRVGEAAGTNGPGTWYRSVKVVPYAVRGGLDNITFTRISTLESRSRKGEELWED